MFCFSIVTVLALLLFWYIFHPLPVEINSTLEQNK
jgi:hypothetical protein